MDTPRTLYLHVGLPKTATSALQRWFCENPESLARARLVYPGGNFRRGDKQQFLVGDLRRARMERFECLLAESDDSSVLMSSEGLSTHFDDFPAEALARFREMTRSMRVQILLVRRDPDAWLRSFHKQCVVNPRKDASELWGTALTLDELMMHPRVRRLLDPEGLAAEMKAGFGAQGVRVLQYGPCLFDDVLSWLGVRGEAMRLARVNESIPDWAVELIRRLNAAGVPEPRRNWWKAWVAAFVDSTSNEMHPDTPALEPGVDSDMQMFEHQLGAGAWTTPAQAEQVNMLLQWIRRTLPDR